MNIRTLVQIILNRTCYYPVEIPATGFHSISNSSRRYLNRELDGVSDPIYIPYGFAFGEETFTKAYVSKHITYIIYRT